MENTEAQTTDPVRIGMMDSLYMAPLVHQWKKSVQRKNWLLVEDSPDELHRKFAAKELDIGFLSAFSYGTNYSEYKLLPGISISSSSAVGIGILFSHVPLDQLRDKAVSLAAEMTSTVALVRVILEDWHNVTPRYFFSSLQEPEQTDVKAVLASGNAAVRLAEKPDFLYQFDLGDIWKRKMELPFVFAVCVVRREFCDQFPEVVDAVHQELLRCCNEGSANLADISSVSAGTIPFSVDKCRHYLDGIRYELAGRERHALQTFLQLLCERGELEEEALSLPFFIREKDE